MPSFVLRTSAVATPEIARPEGAGGRPSPAAPEVFLPELVSRQCALDDYEPFTTIRSVRASDKAIAYCSPDSTYAVTRKLFDGARRSIVIGIYDLSAKHVVELIENALQRGVTVQLMLDIDSDRERALFDELKDLGVDAVPAPSCASERANFFRSSHQKFIIIDDEWVIVQSGNYSNNSIPLNVTDGGDAANFRKGNRDTGLAIKSRALANFFRKVIEKDIALELSGPEALRRAQAAAETVFLIERAPARIPERRFPSKTFTLNSELVVQPVLSPDNYMKFVPGKLRDAKRSILIQQQYIRASQEKIVDLLEAIKAARDDAEDFDIRIILGKVFSARDLPKERANLDLLKSEYGLKLGKNIRYVDTTRFVHCHNKMILIDGKGVLVGSQNWSKSAVFENREASLWLEHTGIARYFSEMFESDWKTAQKTLGEADPETVSPEALGEGGFVRVEAADYREV